VLLDQKKKTEKKTNIYKKTNMAPKPSLLFIFILIITYQLSHLNHLTIGFPAFMLIEIPHTLLSWLLGETNGLGIRRTWAHHTISRLNAYPPPDLISYSNFTARYYAALIPHRIITCSTTNNNNNSPFFKALVISYQHSKQSNDNTNTNNNSNDPCTLSSIDSINVDHYIIYFHGGFDSHSNPYSISSPLYDLSKWAFVLQKKKVVIIIPWLPLTPNERFPTQQMVGLSTYEFLITRNKIDPKKIIFGGDFTGGTIALNLAGDISPLSKKPRAVFVVSPWLVGDFACPRKKEHLDVISCSRLAMLTAMYTERHMYEKAFPGQRQGVNFAPWLVQLPDHLYIWSGENELLHQQTVEFIELIKNHAPTKQVIFHSHSNGHNSFPLHDDPWIGEEAYLERKHVWMTVIDKLL
jgi:acetyl esterase/lipase